LKLFQDTFIPSSSGTVADAGTGTADEDSSDDDSAYTAPSPVKAVKRVLSTASMNTSTEGEDERAPISVPVADGSSSNTVALQFFNLPYRISPEQVRPVLLYCTAATISPKYVLEWVKIPLPCMV
jgi:hypothetical protein